MQNYVDLRMSENSNKDRKPYKIYGNNCDSFARITVDHGYTGAEKIFRDIARNIDITPDRPSGNPAKEMSYDPKTNAFIWGKTTIIVK